MKFARLYVFFLLLCSGSGQKEDQVPDQVPIQIGSCTADMSPSIYEITAPTDGIEIGSSSELPLLFETSVWSCRNGDVQIVFEEYPDAEALLDVEGREVACTHDTQGIPLHLRRFLLIPPQDYCWEYEGFANGEWKWHVEVTNTDTAETVTSESRSFTVNIPLECESAAGRVGSSFCNKCLDGCAGLPSCCMETGCSCQDACSYANQNLDCSMYGSDWHPEIETDSYVGPTGEYFQWIVARGCCHNDCSGIKASYEDDVRDLCTGCLKCHDAVEKLPEEGGDSGNEEDSGEGQDEDDGEDGHGSFNSVKKDNSASSKYYLTSHPALWPLLSGCLLSTLLVR